MGDSTDLFEQICAALPRVEEEQDDGDDVSAYGLLQYTYQGDAGATSMLPFPNYPGARVLPATFPAVPHGAGAMMAPGVSAKMTVDGRVACPFCGSPAETLGGAKRGEKYAFMCRATDCAQRWNQRRDPNEAGDLEITISKRAIGNEPRRSGGYACGICGFKPKQGHVCAGKMPVNPSNVPPLVPSVVVAPPALPDMQAPVVSDGALASQVAAAAAVAAAANTISAVLPMTTTPVRPLVSASLVAAAVAPSSTPQSATDVASDSLPIAPSTLVDDCDQTGQKAELEATDNDQGGVTTSVRDRAREQGTVEALNSAIVAEGIRESLLDGRGSGMGRKVDTMPVAETGEETGEDLVDHKYDDDAPTDAALAAAAALETPSQGYSKSSTSNLASSQDEKMDMQTDQANMNGHEVYKHLQLVRKKVKGDGSCWVYAMLECAGLLQHGGTDNDPSSRDRGMDALCRIMSNVYMAANKDSLDLSAEEIESMDSVLRVPEYPLVEADDYGEFGTITTIIGLAFFFKVSVVVWNKKTLRSRGIRQQVVEYLPETNEVKERNCTYDFICAIQGPLMHIEWDGVNHYAAVVAKGPVTIDSTVRSRLLQVPPVTHQKPVTARASKRPTEAPKDLKLPDGWVRMTNRIRNDGSKCLVVKAPKALQTHLTDALRQGFNAVIMINYCGKSTSTVKYLKYDFQVTEDITAETGDFSTVLYVHSGNKKHKLSAPAFDAEASCLCGKFYLRKESEMQCLKCGRWCHVSCVFGPIDAAAAEEAAKLYVCGECCHS